MSSVIRRLAPSLVHFTGPHLWNPLLLRSLHRASLPTVHTLHDLHPHHGATYGRLLYLWNDQVRRRADHLLVHGRRYRDELVSAGVAPARIACTLLTHLFMGYEQEQALAQSPPEISYEPWALFMGRLEAYKGLDVLIQAARILHEGRGDAFQVGAAEHDTFRSEPLQTPANPLLGMSRPYTHGGATIGVIAGPGSLHDLVPGPVPPNVELRQGLISDAEAIDLFCRCSVVVLPYVEASQSALIAAAYAFRKPVIVTRAGALPEYVVEGETGWVIPPGDAPALARALHAALHAALANPARLAEMGQAGHAWAQRQRQQETATLTALYTRLAATSRS